MVYDCFQFFNELDILKLRMHVMNDVADRFVVSESTVTFSGEKKPLYFQENREMFAEFADKIIYRVVDDTPIDVSPFLRDSHQKCAVARGLAGADPEDVVIFSDVDEIPNPEAVKKVLEKFDDSKIYALAQRNFTAIWIWRRPPAICFPLRGNLTALKEAPGNGWAPRSVNIVCWNAIPRNSCATRRRNP